MHYELKNVYTELQEGRGILQNKTGHCVEFITAKAMPKIATIGLIIRPGENFSYAVSEGKRAYARCVNTNATALIVIDDCANFKQPASDGTGAGCNIDDTAIAKNKTWSSTKISEMIASCGSGAGNQQITKLNVTAPKPIEIPIDRTNTFCKTPVEVLKFIPGTEDLVTTICAFDNGDAGDFTVGGVSGEVAKSVTFDGTMRPDIYYKIAMGDPAQLEDGFVSESEAIDLAAYKQVEAVE